MLMSQSEQLGQEGSVPFDLDVDPSGRSGPRTSVFASNGYGFTAKSRSCSGRLSGRFDFACG